MNITPSSPVWLFDLDNTLHNASHAIFPAITANMNTYMARVLGNNGEPAGMEQVNAARTLYWRRYGATMLGLVKHHGVDAAHFLKVTHDFPQLAAMVRAEKGLGQLLRALPGRKVLLTNAPHRYSRDVLRILGIHRRFSHHIAIEHMRIHRQLRPKPSTLLLRNVLRRQRVAPRNAILVEDTLANLRAACALGMRTAWVTQYLKHTDPIGMAHVPRRFSSHSGMSDALKNVPQGRSARPTALIRPGWVDVKVKSVRHLPARLSHLVRLR